MFKKEKMKIRITYCNILSDHILATPEETSSEIVEVKNMNDPALKEYIEAKKDWYGHNFKKASVKDKKTLGFDYISHAGGVKLYEYVSPKIKKL